MEEVSNCTKDENVHCLVENTFEKHCKSVGSYLRDLRMTRNLRTTDIAVVCANMKVDCLHSAVGAVHSNYIDTMLQKYKTPIRIFMENCKYAVVSSVVDWMYTGEIEVTPRQYGEYLKVASTLRVSKLLLRLERALELLATQNDYLTHCINIAADPECVVSAAICGAICTRFVANMHVLSDSDIENLSMHSIVLLVSSPRIKGKEKIEIINFALRWLKSESHRQFLDPILGSLHMDILKSDQLVALVKHLRYLYRKLPECLLAPVHIYVSGKKVVVSADPKKYACSSNVIVPKADKNSSEKESAEPATKHGNRNHNELTSSQIAEITQLPNFTELIKQLSDVPSRKQGTKLLRSENSQMPFGTSECQIRSSESFGNKLVRHHTKSSNSADVESVFDEAATNTNQSSAPTVNRCNWSSQSLEDIQNLPSLFCNSVDDSGNSALNSDDASISRGEYTDKTVGRYAFGQESLSDIDNLPDQFSKHSEHCARLAAGRTSSERSLGMFGRNFVSSKNPRKSIDISDGFMPENKAENVKTEKSFETTAFKSCR